MDKLKSYEGGNFVTTQTFFMNRGEPIYVKNYLSSTKSGEENGYKYITDTPAVYLLDGKYKRLTGYVCAEDGSEGGCEVEIYGDGALLYHQTVEVGEKPIKMDVNIVGVDKLEIRYHYLVGGWDYWIQGRTAVYDVFLEKVD